ncbi:hypothetical protein [Acinetobacter johnsonii]|uniref:hypothetical protein n=1 Tax=Acinetobacter johnsonii TaxID=40214 RepID=UPI0021CDD1FE|nr:hypothetical protein [Acinetobacter johnsonii]
MDIQKEKIAHEKHLFSQGVDFKYLPNIQYSELENVYELIEWDEEYSEALNEINSSWCTWQAAKAQAVPEGFVLVKKELPEQIAEKMAIDRIDKPRHENDPVWREIAEQSYKDRVKSKKWEFWRDYKAMIEAQEPANE